MSDSRADLLSDYPASLPKPAKERLEQLQGLNTQHETFEQQYEEERKALEKKYQTMYDPLYAKRAALVGGDDGRGSGIPRFWFVAMMNCEVVSEAVQPKDRPALEAVLDVKCILLEDSMSFRLAFEFGPNEYFTNTTLEKTYHLVDDDEPILEKAEGCEIQWKAGKNLTMKTMKKKVPAKGGKKPVTKTKQIPCDSFFNFFGPPDLEELEQLDEEEEEEMQELIQMDFEIGAAFRERIVPHAVLWFTGEAADEDDEYEDDESDEDGEEEGPRRGRDGGRGTRAAGESRGGGGSAHGSGGGAAAEDGEAADGETECKQQ